MGALSQTTDKAILWPEDESSSQKCDATTTVWLDAIIVSRFLLDTDP